VPPGRKKPKNSDLTTTLHYPLKRGLRTYSSQEKAQGARSPAPERGKGEATPRYHFDSKTPERGDVGLSEKNGQ